MLIKCLECGNQVSDKAKSCPHCGAPLRTTLKQISEKFSGIKNSERAQQIFHGNIAPYFTAAFGIVAFICFGATALALLSLLFTWGEDEEALGFILVMIPVCVIIAIIGALISRRKLNIHMRSSDFLETALEQIQKAQSPFPERKRSYKIANIPDYGAVTAEQIHREMMDVIIMRNAVLVWKGATPSKPSLGADFIYERDIEPYVNFLMFFKESIKNPPLDEVMSLSDGLKMFLDQLRDYEALQNEVKDKVVRDTLEYDRRMKSILVPPAFAGISAETLQSD